MKQQNKWRKLSCLTGFQIKERRKSVFHDIKLGPIAQAIVLVCPNSDADSFLPLESIIADISGLFNSFRHLHD